MYIAVFSCVTALAGITLGSLTGGVLLEVWNSRGMFTGAVDRYQVLFIIPVVLRLGFTLLFVPVLQQDSELKPHDLLRHILGMVTHPHRQKMNHQR